MRGGGGGGEDLFHIGISSLAFKRKKEGHKLFSYIFCLSSAFNSNSQYIKAVYFRLMCSELLCIHRKKETSYPLSEPTPRVVKSEQVAFLSFM